MQPLPPGQRESSVLHRFGLLPFAQRFPRNTTTPVLRVSGKVENPLDMEDPLRDLPRVEQVSDFHCVTTWSVRALRWEGVRFRDFFDRVIAPRAIPHEEAVLVASKGQDGARTGMLLEDLLDPSVLLADHLDGKPLSVDHGAPLRLVAPEHYAYKSVKYLSELSFLLPEEGYRVTGFRFMDHPRARVALEERGRVVPGLLLRFLYRPLIRTTASRFAAASKQWQARSAKGLESE